MEEQGMTYLADPDPESALVPLQAAACTYRVAFGAARRTKSADLANAPQPSGTAYRGALRQ